MNVLFTFKLDNFQERSPSMWQCPFLSKSYIPLFQYTVQTFQAIKLFLSAWLYGANTSKTLCLFSITEILQMKKTSWEWRRIAGAPILFKWSMQKEDGHWLGELAGRWWALEVANRGRTSPPVCCLSQLDTSLTARGQHLSWPHSWAALLCSMFYSVGGGQMAAAFQ